jgi:tRNA threonylcarbamoyladenosine biosynthesis protein TsaE
VPDAEVASPSFAIVSSYHGRIPVHHADLYRVGDYDELYATGFTDLVGGAGATLVEWADRVPGALPAERLEVRLWHDPRRPSVRRVELRGLGERHAALAESLRPRRPSRAPAPRGAARGGSRRGPSPRGRA